MIKQYHKLVLDKSGKVYPRSKEALFISFYNKKITILNGNSIQTRMERIREKSSFRNEKLSLKNIRYTVIKQLLSNYTSDRVSEIVGIEITKVEMFIENGDAITDKEEYINIHPFNDLLILPIN